MRFITTRDLRNTPGKVRRLLAKDDLVLTAGGKPVAYLIGLDEDELEEVRVLVRRARAQAAVSRMRSAAAERGVSEMSPEEVDAAIRRARKDRARRR